MEGKVQRLEKYAISIFLPENSLKAGKVAFTSTKAMIHAIKLNRMDSIKNCPTSCPCADPITLRTPTSLALLLAPAVERFMKLIAAINKIKKATAAKM